MSIDRLETLKAIKVDGQGLQRMHVIRPDGRNEYFQGVVLVQYYNNRALVIEESPERLRIIRLVAVADPEVAQDIAQYSLYEKTPPVAVRIHEESNSPV